MGFKSCSPKHCMGDQEEDELGEACSMHRGDKTILKMCAWMGEY